MTMQKEEGKLAQLSTIGHNIVVLFSSGLTGLDNTLDKHCNNSFSRSDKSYC